jgi:hypothetical protein
MHTAPTGHANLAFFGCVQSQGGLADYFTVPVDRLHVSPTISTTTRLSSSNRS